MRTVSVASLLVRVLSGLFARPAAGQIVLIGECDCHFAAERMLAAPVLAGRVEQDASPTESSAVIQIAAAQGPCERDGEAKRKRNQDLDGLRLDDLCHLRAARIRTGISTPSQLRHNDVVDGCYRDSQQRADAYGHDRRPPMGHDRIIRRPA